MVTFIGGTGCGDNLIMGFYADPTTVLPRPVAINGTVCRTEEELFKVRVRCSVASMLEYPNRVQMIVLNEAQVGSEYGKKWMKLLKEEGFEFIRKVDNSVHSRMTMKHPASVAKEVDLEARAVSCPLYVFMLMRNIGTAAVDDPYEPPKAWKELKGPVPEASQALTEKQRKKLVEDQKAGFLSAWKSRPTFPKTEPLPTTASPSPSPNRYGNECPCHLCVAAREREKNKTEAKAATGIAEGLVDLVQVANPFRI